MKIMKGFLFLLITLSCFVGCGTIASVPYSFTGNGNGTAEITFQTNLNRIGGAKGGGETKKSILLISVDGNEIPLPEMRTVWNPVSLPPGIPLTLNVNIFYFYTPKSSSGNGSFGTGTALDILLFPVIIAGAVVEATVEIVDDAISYASRGWRNMDVTFNCPPLESGKKYKLEYIERWFQKPRLVLTDISTKKIVHEQQVEENWQVGGRGNWQGIRENVLPK